jgi:hypothetical protein
MLACSSKALHVRPLASPASTRPRSRGPVILCSRNKLKSASGLDESRLRAPVQVACVVARQDASQVRRFHPRSRPRDSREAGRCPHRPMTAMAFPMLRSWETGPNRLSRLVTFRAQLGKNRREISVLVGTLNQRVPGSSPGAPTKEIPAKPGQLTRPPAGPYSVRRSSKVFLRGRRRPRKRPGSWCLRGMLLVRHAFPQLG